MYDSPARSGANVKLYVVVNILLYEIQIISGPRDPIEGQPVRGLQMRRDERQQLLWPLAHEHVEERNGSRWWPLSEARFHHVARHAC